MKFKHYINSAFVTSLSDDSKADKGKAVWDEVKYKKLKTDRNPFKGGFNRKHIKRVCGYPEHYIDLLLWPGNTFALCASFLDKKGDYRQLITGNVKNAWMINDKKTVLAIGKQWFDFISTPLTELDSIDIKRLVSCIFRVFHHRNLNSDVEQLRANPEFTKGLLILCLAADQSFHEIDVLSPLEDTIAGRIAEFISINNQEHSFQLSMTDNNFGTVHYKSSVCQSGISLNSISHKLAFISAEAHLDYVERLISKQLKRDTFNILILPWPKVISRTCFSPVIQQNMLEMESDFGFFEYAPEDEVKAQDVIVCLENAIDEIGDIDIVVLPECAVSKETAKLITGGVYDYCKSKKIVNPTIITGVYHKGDDNRYGSNELALSYSTDVYASGFEDIETITQNKHHRWFLDRSQIYNYKLGNTLSPRAKWWEYTSVKGRTLISYYCQQHNVQISPLICEDLARQDPVAPVVRALGPNLIVALLLDGGQIKERWPGRYASFLSEDPGSSVLTVSPIGMTMRSDGTGYPPSRTVAFWSEPGFHKEIDLEKNKEGIILTLEKSDTKQWTADGRDKNRLELKYAGHVCI